MRPPVVVRVVTHRAPQAGWPRVNTVGVVQKRRPRNVARNGGRAWAAWVYHALNGLQLGPAQRFETFGSELAARKYADRVARRAQP